MARISPLKTDRARTLRREATRQERAVWSYLRYARPRFTRQLPVGSYILDFACRRLKIAVEIDGSQHFSATSYDAERTMFLKRLGWRVLRFWNSEVHENAAGVAEAIGAAVQAELERTHPRPLPFREGS